MGCCHSDGAVSSSFSLISVDSMMNCFSFLNPIDLTHINITCKEFNIVTNASTKSVQEYWKHQCIFICEDVLDAIQCNNFNTENWFDFYVELQQLIVHLTRHEYKEDIIHITMFNTYMNRISRKLSKRSRLYHLYACNDSLHSPNAKKFFPLKLIKFNDTPSQGNMLCRVHKYVTIIICQN